MGESPYPGPGAEGTAAKAEKAQAGACNTCTNATASNPTPQTTDDAGTTTISTSVINKKTTKVSRMARVRSKVTSLKIAHKSRSFDDRAKNDAYLSPRHTSGRKEILDKLVQTPSTVAEQDDVGSVHSTTTPSDLCHPLSDVPAHM